MLGHHHGPENPPLSHADIIETM